MKPRVNLPATKPVARDMNRTTRALIVWDYPDSHNLNFSNRPVRTRMPGGVGGVRSAMIGPYPDSSVARAVGWHPPDQPRPEVRRCAVVDRPHPAGSRVSPVLRKAGRCARWPVLQTHSAVVDLLLSVRPLIDA